MLGTFSLGDYLKKKAMESAWEWVTGKDWLAIAPDRLYITVHHSDDEARRLWRQIGHRRVAHLRTGGQGQLLADGRDRAVRAVLGDPGGHSDQRGTRNAERGTAPGRFRRAE